MREILMAGLELIKRIYADDASLKTVLIRVKIILDLLFRIKDQAELLANSILDPERDICDPETRAQFVLEVIAELREQWYVQ